MKYSPQRHYNIPINPSKKNYSKLLFAIVYYTSKPWYYGTLIYYRKLWYNGTNHGNMDKTMVLWTKIWYYIENNGFTKEKKTWYITKN